MIDRRSFLSFAAEGAAVAAISSPSRAADFPKKGIIASNEQKLVVGDKTISYTATVDATLLPGKNGQPEARIVTTGYFVHGQSASRPLIFAYNGGPGSASVKLHLRVLGPRRLDTPSNPDLPIKPPYKLVPNPHSVLPFADIVLIDPVGSGYSRLFDQSKEKEYYSVDGDGKYISAFIRQWLIENKRENVPVYILGESYGGMRTVAVIKHLINDPGIKVDVRGLILMSTSTGALETAERRTNIVGYSIGLETIAAIAWYYKKGEMTNMTLDAVVGAMRQFTATEYLPGLYLGRQLPNERKMELAQQLARFSGLPAQTWLDQGLMISREDYRRLLFKDKNIITGVYDARYRGPANGDDPSVEGLDPAIDWAIGTLMKDIGVKENEPYRLTSKPYPVKWTYAPFSIQLTNDDEYRVVDYPQDLMDAMTTRPGMRLILCGGYFDNTASIGADEYLLRRNNIPMERVTLRHYIGGHMFYSDDSSRAQFMQLLQEFVTA